MLDTEQTITKYSECLDLMINQIENMVTILNDSDPQFFQSLDAMTHYLAGVLVAVDAKLDELVDKIGETAS